MPWKTDENARTSVQNPQFILLRDWVCEVHQVVSVDVVRSSKNDLGRKRRLKLRVQISKLWRDFDLDVQDKLTITHTAHYLYY